MWIDSLLVPKIYIDYLGTPFLWVIPRPVIGIVRIGPDEEPSTDYRGWYLPLLFNTNDTGSYFPDGWL